MEVKLLDHAKLSNAVIGARTCWNSFHKGGNYDTPTDNITDEDKELLDRLIHKNKHESIAEHITNVFKITGITRMVLIEMTRHRISSYSVKSTRYTLKELRDEAPFLDNDGNYTDAEVERASKYIDLSPTKYDTTFPRLQALENLRRAVINSKDIDEIKYLVPECYLTDLVFTINARSLKNFLKLRLSKAAHYKIRELAKAIYFALPQEHRFLYAPETKELREEIEEDSKNNDFESIKPLLDELYEQYINLDDGTEDGAICAEEVVAYGLPDIFAQANASKALRERGEAYFQNLKDNS